jgi:hypothetical protein
METKFVTIDKFSEVARNNDFFLWHFLKKNQEKGILSLFSYSKNKEGVDNKIKEIIDLVGIPYFESYTEDSIDFLHDVGGFEYKQLWNNGNTHNLMINNDERFNPVIIGFKKFNKVSDTFKKCYCVDGLLEVITDLNPEFLIKINTED